MTIAFRHSCQLFAIEPFRLADSQSCFRQRRFSLQSFHFADAELIAIAAGYSFRLSHYAGQRCAGIADDELIVALFSQLFFSIFFFASFAGWLMNDA
jgi:hypothetical protein